jgi:hypothetical protein
MLQTILYNLSIRNNRLLINSTHMLILTSIPLIIFYNTNHVLFVYHPHTSK